MRSESRPNGGQEICVCVQTAKLVEGRGKGRMGGAASAGQSREIQGERYGATRGGRPGIPRGFGTGQKIAFPPLTQKGIYRVHVR